MSREAVDQLLYLYDGAFEGIGFHNLLGNLKDVTDEDWTWTPPGGHRTIRDIVLHVGESTYVYDNHAFGDASMRWDRPETIPRPPDAGIPGTIAWLREGHRRLRHHVAALDDGQLSTPRLTNWGELRETRWIIGVMIGHDFYHAGEINHLRALRQGNDRWAWEQG